jgi:exosortase
MADSLTTLDRPDLSDSANTWKDQFGSHGVWYALAGALTLLLAIFFERFVNLGSVWAHDANYSHGFLIVPISVGLAIRNLMASKQPLKPELLVGGCTLALGCVLLIVTTLVHFSLADYLALCMVLRGSAVIMGGRAWASALSFPIFFLFFMFPLPIAWTNFASVWLQDWVSVVSGKFLGLFFVCHQRGNMIILAGADQPLHVAQECSGLRQLVAFLALAVLMTHLSRRGIIFGLFMILAAVPIAILSNVLRVLLMAIMIRYFGAASVSGWLHDLPALVTLPIGILFFFLLLKSVGDFFPLKPESAEKAV